MDYPNSYFIFSAVSPYRLCSSNLKQPGPCPPTS